MDGGKINRDIKKGGGEGVGSSFDEVISQKM